MRTSNVSGGMLQGIGSSVLNAVSGDGGDGGDFVHPIGLPEGHQVRDRDFLSEELPINSESGHSAGGGMVAAGEKTGECLVGDGAEASDESLVSRICEGNATALKLLWLRYSGLLYSQAQRVLNNQTEAEDVVVEVFEEVWNRASGYHETRAKPVAWLLTLARRRAIDRLRERQSYLRAGERLKQELSTGGDSDGNLIEDHLRLCDLRRVLDLALGQLPETQRKTVRLAYYEGLSQREISECTQTSLGTVKSRMETGLRKLRENLRAENAWSMGMTL